MQARLEGTPVHDQTIRRWALYHAKLIGLTEFKAWLQWINKFKKGFGFSSRKICLFTSVKKQCEAEQTINKGVECLLDFVDNIYSKFDASKIFNTDQSGFNYTPLPNRTLSFKGEKNYDSCNRSIKRSNSFLYYPTGFFYGGKIDIVNADLPPGS